MRGLVRVSTGKAIESRGPGHSVNRRTLKIEKLLSSSPSQKSALRLQRGVGEGLGKGWGGFVFYTSKTPFDKTPFTFPRVNFGR